MSYTPGPWFATQTGKTFWITANPGTADSPGTGVKGEHYLSVSGCVSEDDANLIAAAPELLEALYDILNIEGACFGADSSWNLEYHWNKVRAAIAKAEGRQ